MRIAIIAAIASNGAIGLDGQLLYHFKEDMQRFKNLTLGHPVIMGRKTFESLPKGALPGRRNIVITSQQDWSAPNVIVAHSLGEALNKCSTPYDDPRVFIIGGASIYKTALSLADEMYITAIDARPAHADTFFPAFNKSDWRVVRIARTKVENGPLLSFIDYVKDWRKK